jgi:two-component system phosphate regulon sensor histidine kinase PhoR
VELVAFLEGILAEMAPLADKKGIVMSFGASSNDIRMQTDRAALRNIVQTYLSNAVEYTPEGGRIDLRVDEYGNDVRIAVRDTGIGIPSTIKDRLFQKFVRGENARLVKPGGVGLGLYLAKKAAQLVGGMVWFESEEGAGTTFYAQIPKIVASRSGGKPLA